MRKRNQHVAQANVEVSSRKESGPNESYHGGCVVWYRTVKRSAHPTSGEKNILNDRMGRGKTQQRASRTVAT